MKSPTKKAVKKPVKKKRHVLGEGYPWFQTNGETRGPHEVRLYEKVNGNGHTVTIQVGKTGAWKKYRLILEEI